MYPYTKRLTLDEALNILVNAKCQSYENDGKVYLTALDYATYILNQPTPPEGWGYAAYELDSGRYDSIAYCKFKNEFKEWETSLFKNDWRLEKRPFYEVCFHLTDLARVEAEKVELTTRQSYYLSENNSPIQKEFYHGIYYISKADYDSMPQEFKDLGISEKEPTEPATCCPKCYDVMTELKQEIAELEAKLNAEVQNTIANNDSWKIAYAELQAKNKELKSDKDAAVMLNKTLSDNATGKIAELEEKLKTAKHYAENLSDKLNEAEETLKKYGTRSEVYIRAMEHKLTLLDQLKQADIEIAKASFDYYPKF